MSFTNRICQRLHEEHDGTVALMEDIAKMKDMKAEIRSHPDAIYAGAIGAALWGAYRFEKLAAQGNLANAA